jgi:hypothetical protein
MLCSPRDELSPHLDYAANYHLHVDYDADYARFGRGEKQLATLATVSNPPPEATGGGFFLLPRQ